MYALKSIKQLLLAVFVDFMLVFDIAPIYKTKLEKCRVLLKMLHVVGAILQECSESIDNGMV